MIRDFGTALSVFTAILAMVVIGWLIGRNLHVFTKTVEPCTDKLTCEYPPQ